MEPQQMTPPSEDQGGIDSVEQGEADYLWKTHRRSYISVLVVSCIAAAMLAAALYQYDPHSLSSDQNDSSFILVLLVLFVPAVIMNMRASANAKHDFFTHMADLLGFSYSQNAPHESVSGIFFTLGHGQNLSDILSGKYKDRSVRIFDYLYITGYGKSQRTHTYCIFELQYDSSLPHVLMNIPEFIAPSDVERVELEGNFDKNFNLFVSNGRQMEIREIFQPDIMQEFISSLSACSMEITGDRIYLMRPGSLPSDKKGFLDLIAMIEHIFDDLLPGLRAVGQS